MVTSCCCKTQQAIHAEAAATRDLLQNTKIDDLRDRLECSRRDNYRHQSNESIRINIENVLRNRNVS
jgi:hypothetical protein